MAKSKNTTKKRISKKAQGPANHLKIWVGVLVVLIVAVVGVVVVRFSEAFNPSGFVGDYNKVVDIGKAYGWSVRQKDVGFGRYIFYFKPGQAYPSVCYGALGTQTTARKFGGQNPFVYQANRYRQLNCSDIPNETIGSSTGV